MKPLKFCLFLTGIIILSLCAQAQNRSTTIKVQAMDMATAIMKNDFNSFVKYMHPNIIAFAGGKEKMKAKMDSAYQAMKLFGVNFKRYWIGDPGEMIPYRNQLQGILPQSTTLVTSLGEVTVETSMIVISNDNGQNWWFIDTNVYREVQLKDALIDISPALVLPPRKKPKLVPIKNE